MTDWEKNYNPNRLFEFPNRDRTGAYVAIAGEGEVEETVGEFLVHRKSKIVLKMYYIYDRADWSRLVIIRYRHHEGRDWIFDQQIEVNQFDSRCLQQFLELFSALEFSEPQKRKIDLGTVSIGALSELLQSSLDSQIIKQIAESPSLERDIVALHAKRAALATFETMMEQDLPERDWQAFFESNQWIFGYGLNFVSMQSVYDKLEARTTGSTEQRPGKRVDGLLKTRAHVSQTVLVENKLPKTPLLQNSSERPGVWSTSGNVAKAVAQIQKTVFEYSRDNFRVFEKDGQGNDLNSSHFVVQPKSYLIIGNTSQMDGNEDKITCFELYRRNLTSPEIVTFDELLERARYIVEHLENTGHPKIEDDTV